MFGNFTGQKIYLFTFICLLNNYQILIVKELGNNPKVYIWDGQGKYLSRFILDYLIRFVKFVLTIRMWLILVTNTTFRTKPTNGASSLGRCICCHNRFS